MNVKSPIVLVMEFVQVAGATVHLVTLELTVKSKHVQLFVLIEVSMTKALASVIPDSKEKIVNFELNNVHLPTVQVMVLVSMATASVILDGKDLLVLRVSWSSNLPSLMMWSFTLYTFSLSFLFPSLSPSHSLTLSLARWLLWVRNLGVRV